MSVPGTKLVNKQFNSPINLYSPQALQETLDRQTKVLSNGAVGIDFNQLAKPANLQNSAVLRMLEEEEARRRAGHPSLKRVAWPPPPEDQDCVDFVEKSPVQAKTRGEYITYQSSPSSGGSPRSPITIGTLPRGSPQASSPSPLSPSSATLRQPSHFHHQQQQQPVKPWAPVTPPATSPLPHQQSPLQQYNTHPQQYQQQQEQQSWKQQQQQHQDSFNSFDHSTPHQNQSQSIPVYHQPSFEPPPSLITLRPEPPISQAPAPVYQAQPAATMAPISGNMRGDTKWPPESVKAQAEAENKARLDLAKGPAVRPRRVNKDYSGFFAQHALNSTYPGYRAPPGTQYFSPAYQH